MPLIKNQNYVPSRWMFNGHLQTIVPAIWRRPSLLPFERERISTPDGDFLDLDWLRQGSSRLVIISHGLEGNSRRPYMQGMAKFFFERGWDVLSWNFRGCSGELNLQPYFYHSGASNDLSTVVEYAAPQYTLLSLVGFSLGGNMTLKYFGEPHPFQSKIHRGVAISVPLDLSSSCDKISKPENRIYSWRFLKSLKAKIVAKAANFPDQIPLEPLARVRDIKTFDDIYTGPMHGFRGAKDYYAKCSSLHFLRKINHKVLIMSAKNDPFLSPSCYPEKLGEELENVFMEFPEYGGHVGFSPAGWKGAFWSEIRAFEFINEVG
ncbi:YheT family hydrolase [Pleomorphovibrio marinus]|uniref:YheT family hydrolase n=1 Tax=Pleomorphovibrio marinus TaxID=2164132 RepID=UPI000E0CB69C|nr:alpha/beta fold hydrolase [Pleomorphovibrio marinus]